MSENDEVQKRRFRHTYMGIGSVLVILLMILSDPDLNIISGLPVGAGALATIIILVKSVLYVALLHISRKALLDYVDFEVVFKRAMGSSEGAGSFAIAIGLIMISVALVIWAAVSH